MTGLARLKLSHWGVREWAMTALALIAFCLAVFFAGRGLASGAAALIRSILANG